MNLKRMIELCVFPAYSCVRFYTRNNGLPMPDYTVEVSPHADTYCETSGETATIIIGALAVDQVLRKFGEPNPDMWYDIIKFIILHEVAHIIRGVPPWEVDAAEESRASELALDIQKQTSGASPEAEAFIRRTFCEKEC